MINVAKSCRSGCFLMYSINATQWWDLWEQ